MAGDWIKMEVATPDKPEVLAITAKMGWDDPDLAVGKLFRIWRWFDQHTADGNAASVTKTLLDRLVGVTGFADAMESVGWLAQNEAGITLPNFDRHCGKTAKTRALTAKRVAQSKARGGSSEGNAKGNAASVTGALPREEKRRSKPTCASGDARQPERAKTSESFEQFWAAYPKRKSRGHAEKAFAKINPDEQLLQAMVASIERAKTSDDWRKDGGQYVPYPATWLNAKGWEDEIAPRAPCDDHMAGAL